MYSDLIDIVGGCILNVNPTSLFRLRDFNKFVVVLTLFVDGKHGPLPLGKFTSKVTDKDKKPLIV